MGRGGAGEQLGTEKANGALRFPPRARSGCGRAQWTCGGRSLTWGASSASSNSASSAGSAGRSGRPPPSPLHHLSPWRLYVGGSWGAGGGLLGQGLEPPRASPWVTLPAGDLPGEAGQGDLHVVPSPMSLDAPALSLSHHQEGPVEPETFLRAAVQGKMHVIEKFLADGGPPDTCDEVVSSMAAGHPLPAPCHHAPPCPLAEAGTPRMGLGVQLGWGDGSSHQCGALSPQFHRTALHRSSLEGHTDILQKLLDSGATVDFRDRVRLDPAPGSMPA